MWLTVVTLAYLGWHSNRFAMRNNPFGSAIKSIRREKNTRTAPTTKNLNARSIGLELHGKERRQREHPIKSSMCVCVCVQILFVWLFSIKWTLVFAILLATNSFKQVCFAFILHASFPLPIASSLSPFFSLPLSLSLPLSHCLSLYLSRRYRSPESV